MNSVLSKPYIYWTAGIFIAYMIANAALSQFYESAKYIPYYLNTLNWTAFILSIILSSAIGLLLSVNMVTLYIKYRQRAKVGAQSTITCAGAVGGLSTGICSACASGIVPIIFGLLGTSFTWAALPLKGMEVQFLIILMLGGSLFWLSKK